jgi:hypothetical protein
MTDQSTMALVFIAFSGAITGWACYLYNKRQKEIALRKTNREKLFQENIKKRPTLKKATTKEPKMATKPGLYANIAAKKQRIKEEKAEGKPVEKMRKPGTKGAPTAQAFKDSAKTAKKK